MGQLDFTFTFSTIHIMLQEYKLRMLKCHSRGCDDSLSLKVVNSKCFGSSNYLVHTAK